MQGTWQFQLRIDASAELAAALREGRAPEYEALYDVLRRHDATLKCQFDAFMDYVDEAEAHRAGRVSAISMDEGDGREPGKESEVSARIYGLCRRGRSHGAEVADALQLALTSLGGAVGIEGVVRFDTNPANNPRIGA